jgi:hypothetical protein
MQEPHRLSAEKVLKTLKHPPGGPVDVPGKRDC